jgi:hypothetical protein
MNKNICNCEKMKKAIEHRAFDTHKGYLYLSEAKDYSYYDTEMWLIQYCPFCGKPLYEEESEE